MTHSIIVEVPISVVRVCVPTLMRTIINMNISVFGMQICILTYNEIRISEKGLENRDTLDTINVPRSTICFIITYTMCTLTVQ